MLMALLSLARRLQRTHSQILFPFLLHHPAAISSPSPSPSTQQLLFPSLAFHQTLFISSRTLLFTSRFSTLQSLSTQTLNYPFEFTPPAIHGPDSQEQALLHLLKRVAHFSSEAEAMASLDESGIKATQDLVYSVIGTLREEWRLAFLAFKWGEKCGNTGENTYELMIWVLGNHRKFNMAWCLIRDLFRSSMDTRRAMFIMIDRYAAASDPCKAIQTFHTMEKFRMTPDEEAFRTLLNALCSYGYVEEAEEIMLQNKKLFPLETDGFNIVLNGWCNILVDVVEAKRVWREMSKYCIMPNGTSYTHMISCFSKDGNLFDSLRLYNEMKKRGWDPGIEVYKSLVYVLTRENCLNEAQNILKKMKETGLQPDSATYNSMIRPLCEAEKLEEARNILSTMKEENLSPTIETYHAFLHGVGFEGTLEVFNCMKVANLGPTGDTFLLVLGKFFKMEQPEQALKIWAEMKHFEVLPDSSHYIALVEGLVTSGWLDKAREYYDEMRSYGFWDDPKLKKQLEEPKQCSGSKRQRGPREGKRSKKLNLWKGNKVRRKEEVNANKK
ncbi:Pentatricopeptide repeat - like 10 [Theobroma cacao]|uniref:Pentatricopeptide repeat-containing protein At1g80880, mitochondrial n=1 Tax=Theobroma cacao TaxID=3641 RepID=A0AB32UZD9_THECC|nr:PREDICTED: pentatricopeptide repeat-containing protein At1g80880, mitochondrial [Theobroma cacao]WRX27479.1 Pentatricopeptide repeat - like 10 [Theobroma cacao]